MVDWYNKNDSRGALCVDAAVGVVGFAALPRWAELQETAEIIGEHLGIGRVKRVSEWNE